MPLYAYRCSTCKDITRLFRKIKDRDLAPDCALRHEPQQMIRTIEAPGVIGDYAPYSCPVTGKIITGRREHEANLRKHGARVLEPGETEAHKRWLKSNDDALERSFGDTVEQSVLAMSGDERAALGTALESGADITPTRVTGKVAQ